MITIILLAAPGTQALEPAFAEDLRRTWDGSDVTWLATDEAAEFSVPALPDDFWTAWERGQKASIDLAAVPTRGRRKQMLLADMDSTMIEQECIDELADEAGVGARVQDITERAMNGELDFEAALRERVQLLRGLDIGAIETVLAKRITLMPGGKTLIATMKAQGAYTVLVSGGFTAFSSQVAQKLGFDEHRANTLIVRKGVLTGEVGMPILGRQAKVETLQDITRQREMSEADVIAVGDGANDLGMLKRAGLGVALHAKPAVAAQSDIRINFGDLTALLYLQGYAKSDFVS
ncbi:MAG: phosphoserine phosphatase SerB [Pseudomonadota bacterium]